MARGSRRSRGLLPGDASGHAYVGESDRNRSLFLRRGHAYVYFIYGMHFCVNVSGERPGIGAGVLLRALEPIEGVAIMQTRRIRLPLPGLGKRRAFREQVVAMHEAQRGRVDAIGQSALIARAILEDMAQITVGGDRLPKSLGGWSKFVCGKGSQPIDIVSGRRPWKSPVPRSPRKFRIPCRRQSGSLGMP